MSRLRGARSWLAGPRLLLLLYVVGGSGLAVTIATAEHAVMYAMNVDYLLANSAKYSLKRLRLEGYLASGSLVRHEDCEYRFWLSSNGAEIPVRWRAAPDDGVCASFSICEVLNEASMVRVEGYVERAGTLGFVAQSPPISWVRWQPGMIIAEEIPCLPIPTAGRDR